jgi:hypothetical protein
LAMIPPLKRNIMKDTNNMYLRIVVLTILCEIAMVTSAVAHNHLTGKVVSFDNEQGIIIVQPIHEHKHPDNVTIHMPDMPQLLETGMLVHAHGRYRKDDRFHFDAIRVNIEDEDLTGVRKRLRKIHESKSDHPGKSEDIKIPESPH